MTETIIFAPFQKAAAAAFGFSEGDAGINHDAPAGSTGLIVQWIE